MLVDLKLNVKNKEDNILNYLFVLFIQIESGGRAPQKSSIHILLHPLVPEHWKMCGYTTNMLIL